MKIYTKGGDLGETGLYGGDRVAKDHLRIQTYGTLDELNSSLGVVLSLSHMGRGVSEDLADRLGVIQGELFRLGAELATPRGKNVTSLLIVDRDIERLEKEIDAMESVLVPLTSFILPGGAPTSAYLHCARSISRRAERELVTLHRAEPVRPQVMGYLNRLSDYLFVCARFANHEAKIADVPWKG